MTDQRAPHILKFFGVFDPSRDPAITKLQHNQRLLLAYLVFNRFSPRTDTRVRSPLSQRRPVSRTTAALERVHFSARESKDATISFDTALHALRKSLGDRIKCINRTVEFVLYDDDPKDVVDVFEFVKAHYEQDYEAQVTWYTGPLLEGVDSPLLLEHCGTQKLYEDWYKDALHAITSQAIASDDKAKIERAAGTLSSAVSQLPNDPKVIDDYQRLSNWLSQADVREQYEAQTLTKVESATSTVRIVPKSPKPYVAHSYTLLKVKELIGRKRELRQLDDWINNIVPHPVLSIVAMGGVGKSALTWSWFSKQAAAVESTDLSGVIWWSFYHDEASFDKFLARSVAYVCNIPLAQSEMMSQNDQTNLFFDALAQNRFLIVMDGLERLLLAYSRIDAAYVTQEVNDDGEAKDSTYRHAADFSVRAFLRRLARLETSKVLITSRLRCADLEKPSGDPLTGTTLIELTGLDPLDAVDLWRSIGSRGEDHLLMPFFEKIDHHPLLIQSLSGAVGSYPPAPGDFTQWLIEHPSFNILQLDRRQVKTDVLQFAIADVPKQTRQVLTTISAFRMPVNYEILEGVTQYLADESATLFRLGDATKNLIDRGLIGRDEITREYDLHPLVRATAWNWATSEEKDGLYTSVRHYFDTPELREAAYYWPRINRIDDLRPIIEIFNAMIGERLYDDAYAYYNDYLHNPLVYRLKAYRLQTQILEQLFTDDVIPSGHLSTHSLNQDAKMAFAISLLESGQPFRAKNLFDPTNTSLVRIRALIATGALFEAELAIRTVCAQLLRMDDDDMGLALYLSYLGHVLLLQGHDNEQYFNKSGDLLDLHYDEAFKETSAYTICTFAADWLIQSKRYEAAIEAAEEGKARLKEHNSQHNVNRVTDDYDKNVSGDYALAEVLIGTAMLENEDFNQALDQLQIALKEARAGASVDIELRALISCADLSMNLGDQAMAREYLDDTWVALRRGPYPLLEADALWILANIQLVEGDREGAAMTAVNAYRAAWCDGPGFSYIRQLRPISAFLRKLGKQIPTNLPEFDVVGKPLMPHLELISVD